MREQKEQFIYIKGARVHNLKNVSLKIPKNKLVVITGVSGSGKSSLAFDTIYAEGQRRYVESLSAYARQFLGVMDKPEVDKIEGLSPAIAINERSVSKNPRSTVGTITEIYDYLRLLFARIGKPHCTKCGRPVGRQTMSQIVSQILSIKKGKEVLILSPLIRSRKGEHREILEEVERGGFVRVRVDGKIYRLEEALNLKLDKYKRHDIEVLVDRIGVGDRRNEDKGERARIADSVELALKLGKGLVIISQSQIANRKESGNKREAIGDMLFSEHFACPACGINLPEIEPRTFSFNSPYGACPDCQGLGTKLEIEPGLVIPNPRLSIGEGAIRPWATASHRVGRQGWYWWRLQELAKEYDFSLEKPIKNLSKEVIDLILYGNGSGSRVASKLALTKGRASSAFFEGVIPNLKRRWQETDSEYTRAEIEKYMVKQECPICQGQRLRREALAVKVAGKSISKMTSFSISELKKFFKKISQDGLSFSQAEVAKPILKEILARLQFLVDVGLDYLTLERESTTLAGGESQRIRLATQIGSGLSGVVYILDEPSVGLHPRDIGRLIKTLKNLRDLGNTVIVVEHDRETMEAADWIIDVGPGAGENGGKIIAQGGLGDIKKSETLTGDYLAGRKKVEVVLEETGENPSPSTLRGEKNAYLIIRGAKEHNLKNIDVEIPLGKFVCISGVSGSGKSTLMNDILARALAKEFYNAKREPGQYKKILGTENLNKVIIVDQSPIGRTPRSNPATYTGAFNFIRDLFSSTQESKIRGYGSGRFSFNVKGGRCESCRGEGFKKVEMYFLPDIYIQCEECHGKRYNKEVLQVEYRGKNIAQVLGLSISETLKFFKNIPILNHKLSTLEEVGLGYMKLGQPATTLSGGEAQRVKLATELARKATGRTLYILDEPTTGLHFDDVKKLLLVLKKLVVRGNTVLVIEHNLEVIRNADWLIDLGPEGGERGGRIVGWGTPRQLMENKRSYTGYYLKQG